MTDSYDDQPVVTLDEVFQWIRNLLAAIGLMACAAIVGLYCGGFFHYISRRNPGGVISTLLGVG